MKKAICFSEKNLHFFKPKYNGVLRFVLISIMAMNLISCNRKPVACIDQGNLNVKVGQEVIFSSHCSENAHFFEWDVQRPRFSNITPSSSSGLFLYLLLYPVLKDDGYSKFITEEIIYSWDKAGDSYKVKLKVTNKKSGDEDFAEINVTVFD